jgi:hypothetical protein
VAVVRCHAAGLGYREGSFQSAGNARCARRTEDRELLKKLGVKPGRKNEQKDAIQALKKGGDAYVFLAVGSTSLSTLADASPPDQAAR